MKILGIVPAAGKAVRFGGVIKELLPYENESLLRRTIRILKRGGADQVVVLSNPDKVHMHVQDTYKIKNLCYVIQQGDILLEGLLSVTLDADRFLFAMPDTLLPEQCFNYTAGKDSFYLGLFDTQEGHKFGVWDAVRIDDKNPRYKDEHWRAWGVVAWPGAAMGLWRRNNYKDHTQAFNHAIEIYGAETGVLSSYHDFANFKEYRRVLSDS